MPSASQASYAKIGFFIMLGVSLISGTLVYVGGMGSKRNEFIAETFFSDPVSGLDVGSSVNFRGVRVGSVRRISFIGYEYGDGASSGDREKIYVEMAFDTRLFRVNGEMRMRHQIEDLVRRGLHATVSASGVTGLSRIELNFPKTTLKEERYSWTPEHPLIPPAPSILQSAADSVTQILNQLNKMDLSVMYSNMLNVAKGASVSLDSLSTMLSSEQGGVSETLRNVREASASIRDFADQIRANPSSLLRSNTAEELQETRR